MEANDGSGIVSSHAYSILDARLVNGKEKILQLRNPWGSGEWKGAWSDKSDRWTPELKKALGWSDKDDGVFWMPFDDYV